MLRIMDERQIMDGCDTWARMSFEYEVGLVVNVVTVLVALPGEAQIV